MSYLLFIYFVLHMVFTWAMMSLSWFIDLVFYPSFKLVSKKRFQEFEVGYLKKAVFTILPLMVCEGITALLLWYKSYNTPLYYTAFINFILLVVLWVMHFRNGMKFHRKLAEEGFHTKTVQRLQQAHRKRALIWTLRAFAVLVLGLYFLS